MYVQINKIYVHILMYVLCTQFISKCMCTHACMYIYIHKPCRQMSRNNVRFTHVQVQANASVFIWM